MARMPRKERKVLRINVRVKWERSDAASERMASGTDSTVAVMGFVVIWPVCQERKGKVR